MYDVKVLVPTENTAANFKKYISPDFWERYRQVDYFRPTVV